MNLEMVTSIITHAQLSGRINKRIAALKASKPTLQDLSNTITELSCQLQSWWDAAPLFVKDDLRSWSQGSRTLPENVHFHHIIQHHYAYYASLVAIHSILVHPWNATVINIEPDQRQEYARLMANSTDIFVNATRKFILNLPQLEINALTPKW